MYIPYNKAEAYFIVFYSWRTLWEDSGYGYSNEIDIRP